MQECHRYHITLLLTTAMIGEIFVTVTMLYALAHCQRDTTCTPPLLYWGDMLQEKPPPVLWKDATLSSVLTTRQLQVVGGILLGLFLILLICAEVYRVRTKWLPLRLCITIGMFITAILVVAHPLHLDPPTKRLHFIFASILIMLVVAWTWVHLYASPHWTSWSTKGHLVFKIIAVLMVILLVGYGTIFCLRKFGGIKIENSMAILEVLQLLLFIIALLLLTKKPPPMPI